MMMKIRLQVQYRKAQDLRVALSHLRERGNNDPRIIEMQRILGDIETSLNSAIRALAVIKRS